ncbi:hypothetical protein HK097_007713 [Rhizophlyctis rosea]|uniref:[histone H3]-trimethyl-L-lysine(9) demethylase n=1 Tax=Rhizophlyctis rosea TaxID=64517 RepID=A0AAD5SIL5_9FUNG|nr:hypothetical protein HK097_007713 [Rhizophlyctis rosea]
MAATAIDADIPGAAFGTLEPDHFFEPDGIPVFKPTMDQFKDFRQFMKAVEPYGHAAGIIKIIPPAEWTQSLNDVKPGLRKVRIRKPISQEINGGGLPAGAYHQINMEQRRAYTVQEWYDRAQSLEYAPPSFNAEGKILSQPTPKFRKRDRKKVKTDAPNNTTQDEEVEPTPAEPIPSDPTPDQTAAQHAFPTPNASPERQTQPKTDTAPETANGNLPPSPPDFHNGTTEAGSPPPSVSPNNPRKRRREQSDDGDADILFDLASTSDGYTDSRCAELERFYWRNITYMAPMYGADFLGSLFEEKRENPWNPAHLDNLLNKVNVKVPGVNDPYLYFGMWKATFAWHVEDMDLYSINYIHFGAPKQWYSIPPNQRARFELVARGLFADEAHKCPEFLRHKMSIISPKKLAANHVPVHRLVQRAGEFVITFPYGYHQGYNLGFNCAESVNFALDSWVEIGKKASYCRCVGDSVKLDVAQFFGEKKEDADLEEAEEEEEEEEEKATKVTPRRRKRKSTEGEEVRTPAKRSKTTPDSKPVRHPRRRSPKKDVKEEEKSQGSVGEPKSEPKRTAVRIRIQLPAAKCELCQWSDNDGLLPVLDNATSEGQSETSPEASETKPENNQSQTNEPHVGTDGSSADARVPQTTAPTRWAHKSCATWIPETSVQRHRTDGEKEVIVGLDDIPKARWALKCDICKRNGASKNQLKRGACIQCAKGRCVRSYHVTCAIEAKLFMEEVNGVKTCYCPTHDTRAEEQRRREKEDLLRREACGVHVGSVVLVKSHGTFYEGTVQEVFANNSRLRVSFMEGPEQIVPMTSVKTNFFFIKPDATISDTSKGGTPQLSEAASSGGDRDAQMVQAHDAGTDARGPEAGAPTEFDTPPGAGAEVSHPGPPYAEAAIPSLQSTAAMIVV